MNPSLPAAFIDRLTRQFGPGKVQDILASCATKRLPTLRVNTLKTTDEFVMSVFRQEAIQFERVKNIPHAFVIRNRTDRELLEHDLTKSGKIYLQGLTSMLPPIILNPQPGEAILDLCAAPGSKTTQIATLMNNQGRILACEENTVRFEKLQNTINVQGAQIVQAQCGDAALLHHTMPEIFDKILADVPCSAEGRIDCSDPRSYRFWNEKNIIAHAKLQRRLLRSAIACLKPEGTLVYSTCTLAPEENEEMITWILTEFPFMRPESITIPLIGMTHKSTKSVTVLPTKQYEGFFVAKLVKSTSS